MKKKYNQKIKFLLLGEQLVGKTSLLLRFTEEKFKESLVATMGVDYKEKIIELEQQKKVLLQVWDTAGQERFKTIAPIYYKNVKGVLLVFDITDIESFEKLSYWTENLQQNSDIQDVRTVLIGNKSDLVNERKVTYQQAEEFADQYKMNYFETSAKNSQNVQQAFIYLIQQIKEQMGNDFWITENDNLNNIESNKKKKHSGCCTC